MMLCNNTRGYNDAMAAVGVGAQGECACGDQGFETRRRENKGLYV